MRKIDIDKVKRDFEALLNNIGGEANLNLLKPAKVFLALTEGIASQKRHFIALGLTCFNQALFHHYGNKYTDKSLIIGDYCYAQGILVANKTGDSNIVINFSQTIADIASKDKKGFSSIEELAAYLAGYLRNKKDLESFKILGKLAKQDKKSDIESQLSNLGFAKETSDYFC